MIKVILFDCDGPIIKRTKYFSQRLIDLGFAIDSEKVRNFFENEFLSCETGKADLKEELSKRMELWGWPKGVEELMGFWFKGEAEINKEMRAYIISLRKKGIKGYLSTNNEKYRVDYLWNTVGLKNFLDGKLPSAELGFLKPQVEFWEQAYTRVPKVSKEEVLVLDDVESAIHTAKEFGFNAEFYKDFTSFKQTMSKEYNLNAQRRI